MFNNQYYGANDQNMAAAAAGMGPPMPAANGGFAAPAPGMGGDASQFQAPALGGVNPQQQQQYLPFGAGGGMYPNTGYPTTYCPPMIGTTHSSPIQHRLCHACISSRLVIQNTQFAKDAMVCIAVSTCRNRNWLI